MSNDPTWLPHPPEMEAQFGPHYLTIVWIEFRGTPAKSHYWVSIYEEEAGDIWGRSCSTLEEASSWFEKAKASLAAGRTPEMVKRGNEWVAEIADPPEP